MDELSKIDQAATLNHVATLFEEVDNEITSIWMKLPEKVKKQLDDTGVGSKLDALAMANRIKEIASTVESSAKR